MAEFDPDAYLASAAGPDAPAMGPNGIPRITVKAGPSFDPDAYLASRPNVLGDVATQAGAGLVSGVEQLPTAMPRILGAAGNAITPMLESIVGQFSPGKAADMHQADAERQALLATIQQQKAPSLTDFMPQPQTLPGQYARTAAEFVPGMAAAPGSMIRNALTGVGAGLSSEAAGQATAGTALEPYARAGAGLVGGVAGAKMLAPSAAKLTPDAVIAASRAAYQAPEVAAVQIKPQAINNAASNIEADLARARANERLAPQTNAIVDEFRNPVNGKTHTLEDFQTTRELLEKYAGNYANPQEQRAATIAIRALDRERALLPQSDLLAGDIVAANNKLGNARLDYAAGKAAERVQGKLDNADLQAASAHSGGNIDNTIRQKLRPILTSKKGGRGLSEDELNAVNDTVRGSRTGNALRSVGKILGGGGGLGFLHAMGLGAGGGAAVGGVPGALLGSTLPIAGYAIKKTGDAITRRDANRIVQQILSRAPSASSLLPASPISLDPKMAGLLGALLASSSLQPPRAQVPQFAPFRSR